MKKLISTLLSVLMCFSLCLNVGAEEENNTEDSTETTAESVLSSLPTSFEDGKTSYKVKLEDNQHLDETFVVPSGYILDLDLNGHNLDLGTYENNNPKEGTIFEVKGGTLIISDSTDDFKFENNQFKYTSGEIYGDFKVNSNGYFKLYGGSIEGIVYLANESTTQKTTFIMESGWLYNADVNKAAIISTALGCNVEISGGMVISTSGNIFGTTESEVKLTDNNNETTITVKSGAFSTLTTKDDNNKFKYTDDISRYLADGSKIMLWNLSLVDIESQAVHYSTYLVMKAEQTSKDYSGKIPVEYNNFAIDNAIYKENALKTYSVEEGTDFDKNSITGLYLSILNADDHATVHDKDESIQQLFDENKGNYHDTLVRELKDQDQYDNVETIIPFVAYLYASDASGNVALINSLSDGVTSNLSLYFNSATLSKISGKKITLYQFEELGEEGKYKAYPASKVKTTYDEDNKLDFTASNFCVYALVVYGDETKKEEPKKTEETNNNEATSTVVTCAQAMGSKDWIWSESKKACVYKVTNTNAK